VKKKLLKVEWFDPMITTQARRDVDSDWEEVIEDFIADHQISVGFLIYENKDYLILSFEYCKTHVRDFITLPKGCILSRKIIKYD